MTLWKGWGSEDIDGVTMLPLREAKQAPVLGSLVEAGLREEPPYRSVAG